MPDTQPPSPPVLDYARVLYAGGVRFRSWFGAAMWVATAVLAGMFVAAATGRIGDPPAGVGRWAIDAGAALAVLAWAAVSLAIVTDRVDRFELTMAGVQHGRLLVPWDRVTRVVAGGTPAGPTVRLYYSRRVTDGLTTTSELASLPFITVTDYQALTDRLREQVLPTHPHLRLGECEPVRTSDPS